MPFIVYKKCVALETEKANFLKILFLTLKLFRKMISTSNQNTEFQGFFAIKMAEVFWDVICYCCFVITFLPQQKLCQLQRFNNKLRQISHSYWPDRFYTLYIYPVCNSRVVIDHTFMAICLNLVDFAGFVLLETLTRPVYYCVLLSPLIEECIALG